MTTNYEIPSWAGKPPTGLHLDVLKDGKLIQKLMIDEKRCYLFGRNSQLNDFCIDHQSCSRVHAAFVYHKHLHRAFLVDLGSTHGTYIGNIRLEGHKPTQLPVDSSFRFGASTRAYVIRERPQAGPRPIMDELESSTTAHDTSGTLLGLPETETELDNLTEFNTAHNRRITMLGISEDASQGPKGGKKGKRRIRITFNEEEEVINPEDIDPSVGRFRNMVESTVIPRKRPHGVPGLLGTTDSGPSPSSSLPSSSRRPLSGGSRSPPPPSRPGGLYDDLPTSSASSIYSSSLTSKLGISLPNPAPEIELAPAAPAATEVHIHPGTSLSGGADAIQDPDEPKKKKYAKEAWPGKKATPSLLV